MRATDFIKVVRTPEEIECLLKDPGLGVKLLTLLEKQFGCSFGTEGLLAGQSVSSAIDEYLGLTESLQYSDLDVFIRRKEHTDDGGVPPEELHTSFVMQHFKKWVAQKFPHLSAEALKAAYADMQLRGQYLMQRKMPIFTNMLDGSRVAMVSEQAVEATDVHDYTALVEGALQRAAYRISGIHTEGPTQLIYHSGIDTRLIMGSSEALCVDDRLEELAQQVVPNGGRGLAHMLWRQEPVGLSVLRSFDINSVQVGIALDTGAVLFTANYVQFLHNRQLQIVLSSTPFQSLVRAMKKYQHGTCFFDKEEALDVVRHVLAQKLGEPLGCYIPGYEPGAVYRAKVELLTRYSAAHYATSDYWQSVNLAGKFENDWNATVSTIVGPDFTNMLRVQPLGGKGILTTAARIACLTEENKQWLSNHIELLPVKDDIVFPVLTKPETLDSWKCLGAGLNVVATRSLLHGPAGQSGSTLVPIQEVIGLSRADLVKKLSSMARDTPFYVYGTHNVPLQNLSVWSCTHIMVKLAKHKKTFRDKVFSVLLPSVSKCPEMSKALSSSSRAYLLWKSVYEGKLPAGLERLASLPKSKYSMYGWSGKDKSSMPADKPWEMTMFQLYRYVFNRGVAPNPVKKSADELWFRQEVDAQLKQWALREERHLAQMANLEVGEERGDLFQENRAPNRLLMSLAPEMGTLLRMVWDGTTGVERMLSYLRSGGKDLELLSLPPQMLNYPLNEMHAKVSDFLEAKERGVKGAALLMHYLSALLSIAISRRNHRASSLSSPHLRATVWDFTNDIKSRCLQAVGQASLSVEDLAMRELVSSAELLKEGQEMCHCVGGYASSVAQGTSRIVAYALTVKGKVFRATAELRFQSNSWQTAQLYSKRNSAPETELKSIHSEVVKLINDKLLSHRELQLHALQDTSAIGRAESSLQLLMP